VFLWSPVGLTCLSFASQQYAALFTCQRAWWKDGQHGLDLAAPPASLAYPVCSSTLVYEPSDHIRLSDRFSLPIWSALGSPGGVSMLGTRDLMDTRMVGIAYERK